MLDLPPPVPAIEYSIASRGISKGLAQTTGPQMLARGELGFGKLFLGAYAKNIDSLSVEGEAVAVAGIRTKAGKFDLSASAAWKRSIEPVPGADANALELNASVARKLGPLTPKLSLIWSPDDLGSTGRSLFAEASAAYRLTPTLSASLAAARRERTGGVDYTAWNAGLAWNAHKKITFDLRYYDTDGGRSYPFRARGVVTARVKL